MDCRNCRDTEITYKKLMVSIFACKEICFLYGKNITSAHGCILEPNAKSESIIYILLKMLFYKIKKRANILNHRISDTTYISSIKCKNS